MLCGRRLIHQFESEVVDEVSEPAPMLDARRLLICMAS